jgi:putative tryptophan/tyrosine transport system substrate-binding protein
LQGLDLIGKRLQLLQELLPRFARVAYLTDPTEPYSPIYSSEVEAAAKKLGITQVLPVEVSATEQFASAFAKLERDGPDAILIEPNSINFANRKRLADFLLEHKLPGVYGERNFMDRGLMSYGPNISDHFRRAAVHVDKILKGAKPADLPIEHPTKFELIINLKAAKELGLAVPPTLLARADEVIE